MCVAQKLAMADMLALLPRVGELVSVLVRKMPSLLLLPTLVVAGRINPLYAENLTLYHVNPLHEGVVPKDMDTSDINGDIFFDLKSAVVPVECASGQGWSGDCNNGEMVDADLVISKLVVEVDKRFGQYGMCNICSNGTDPLSHLNCTTGEYICTCGGWDRLKVCDRPWVGRENITRTFSHYHDCSWDDFVTRPWSCWSGNVWQKTGGEWYSTLAGAECTDDAEDDEACTWRVVDIPKVVNKTCSDDSVYSAIEKHDSVGCFDACRSGPGQARNVSSACWVGCFYRTILGADGMLPMPNADYGAMGVSLDDLIAAWDAPFSSDDPAQGGCPGIPVARR